MARKARRLRLSSPLSGASVVATIAVFIRFARIKGRVAGGLTAGSVR